MERKFCNNIQPIFTYEEAAKLYFETDVLKKYDKIRIIPSGSGIYMVPDEYVNKDGTFNITSRPCIFKGEDGCILSDDIRPSFCKTSGAKENIKERVLNTIGVTPNFKVIKISGDIYRKELKQLRDNTILYGVLYSIQTLPAELLGMKRNQKYVLVLIDENGSKKISSIREEILEPAVDIDCIKNLTRLHNSLNKYILYRDRSIIELYVDKANRAIDAVNIDFEEEVKSIADKYHNGHVEVVYELLKAISKLVFIYLLHDHPKVSKYVKSKINKISDVDLKKLTIGLLANLQGIEVDFKNICSSRLLDLYRSVDNNIDELIKATFRKVESYNKNLIGVMLKIK